MTVLTSLMPKYTYQDYKNWKDDWELIDGHPWALMPSVLMRHSKVQSKAFIQSGISLERNSQNCNCIVLNDLDWKINEDTVVKPDLMIVCGETNTDFLEFPPVLILEVLSPSTRTKDRTIKFDLYRSQGVKYYLMADYDKHTVEVYELIDNVFREVQKNTFLFDKYCEISFDFDRFWE